MKENRFKKTSPEYLSDDFEWWQFHKEVLKRSDDELKVIQLTLAQWAEEQSQRFFN